jgi:pSer/pThr/pTyr-binding forkhead associated (FHA) protein
MPFLRYSSPEKGVQFIPLDKEVTTVGRSRECDVMLDDVNVSRRHFQVRQSGNGYVLEDLKSKNGTHVNGAPVQHWNLSDGDLIGAGDQKMLYKVQK